MAAKHDISTRADCETLVRAFYEQALTDEIIGFIFTDVAKLDLEAHLPQIASFWESVLLGSKTYTGHSPFDKHVALHAKVALRDGHFERWLVLWFGTVDELFEGEVANTAKIHALRTANAFRERLKGFPSPLDGAPPPTEGIVVTQHRPG